MKRKHAKNELISLLLDQINQLTVLSKIELGDDVIEEIQRLQKIINKPKIKPLTEGKEKLNYKKNPPYNKTTSPPPPPLDRKLKEGKTPRQPGSMI